jgi:hypothetical protein
VVLCALVTLWQEKKNVTKTLKHKIAQMKTELKNGGRMEEENPVLCQFFLSVIRLIPD